MTLSGMTGYGRAEGVRGPTTWAWELRSVNGRGLDVRVRLPSGFDALEPKVREAFKTRFKRGSLSANLQLRRDASAAPASVDAQRLTALLEASSGFIREGLVEPPRLDGLLALRGVLDADASDDDPEERASVEADILATLGSAVQALDVSRREEGAALGAILASVVDQIDALRGRAADHAATQPVALRDRLTARIAELRDGAMDEERLAQEVAVLAAKADVREELDRLAAHVAAARELLKADGPTGRKLDFLTQEFMREANTLCSKSADIELTRVGLDLKAAIDQLREQVQNVE